VNQENTTVAPPSADQFLAGGSKVEGGKFVNPGDVISGTIAEPPRVAQQTDMQQKPKTYSDGNPMWQLVVTLDTPEGQRRLYVKARLRNAVKAATDKAGAPGLEVGGTLAVTFTGFGEAKPGFSAPKEFAAEYTRPGGISQPQAVAQAAQGVGANAEQLAALQGLGIAPTTPAPWGLRIGEVA
tara:strand:+ start:729 stop:1277 length:549 start_codon:yes stop_codon:yes gene_type:complete